MNQPLYSRMMSRSRAYSSPWPGWANAVAGSIASATKAKNRLIVVSLKKRSPRLRGKKRVARIGNPSANAVILAFASPTCGTKLLRGNFQ